MIDNWWQILKGRYDEQINLTNLKPVKGNIPCTACKGTGMVKGDIGYGGTISRHLDLNQDHPLAPASRGQAEAEDPLQDWAGWEN